MIVHVDSDFLLTTPELLTDGMLRKLCSSKQVCNEAKPSSLEPRHM